MSAKDTSLPDPAAPLDLDPPPARIAAIIPVGTLEGAKTRLGDTLDAEERLDLTQRLLARTVAAALAVEALGDVLVISPDREVLRRAAEHGARTLRQRTLGLNAGLAEAREDVVAGGAEAILVLPIDLALVTADAVADVLEPLGRAAAGRAAAGGAAAGRATAGGAAGARFVVLVPDRHGLGTNALALRPPGVIEFAFGQDSRLAHRRAAEAAGAVYVELDSPLAFDLDTPADLIVIESIAPEGIGAG
jgi:2-phospho-L-lactate guanylyltransferase